MADAGAGAGGRMVSPAMVGRSEALARLVKVTSTPPSVVTVEGEAGVGKSRLVAELRRDPALSGRRFLTGGCHSIQEPFPLGPILEAVRGLPHSGPLRPVSPVAGALRPLLPELADLLPPALPVLVDRSAERHRAFRALVALLGATGPAVLVLEDLHWADAQTLDFLPYLISDQPADLSLVVTRRPEESGTPVPANPTAQVVLAPLDETGTGRLAAAIAGSGAVPAEFAAYLHERTGGLPFAVEEVLALLREQGVVVPRDWERGAARARRALAELPVPAAVREHVRERVRRLPAVARPVVEAVAVLDGPVPDWLAVSVTGSPEPEVTAGLSAAVTAGVLVDKPAGVALRHALATQAVYEDLPGPHRRALHARAATGLRTLTPPPLGQIAHHLRQAGRLEEWAEAAEHAAAQAVALGHDREASRLLSDVLREAPLAPARRARLAVALGQATLQTVNRAPVAGLLAQAAAGDVPAAVRGELEFLQATVLEQSADPRVPALFTAAASHLAGRPDLQAWAMIGQAYYDCPGQVDRRRQVLDQALGLLPEVRSAGPRSILTAKIAAQLCYIGDPRWRTLAEPLTPAADLPAEAAPTGRLEVNAALSMAMAACLTGHYPTADRFLATARPGAIASGSELLRYRLRYTQVLTDYCQGAWDDLDQVAQQVIDSQPESGFQNAEVVAGGLALAHGDLDLADDLLTGAVARLAGYDEGWALLPFAAGPLVRLRLARGEVDAAAALVDRVLAGQEPGGFPPAIARALPALTEALLAAGAPERAATLVATWEDGLSTRDAPLAVPAIGFARGLLAATTDPVAAVPGLLTAAASYRRLRCPYEAAQCRERTGLVAAVAGDRPAAVTALRAALAGYRALGASWDYDRAARAARRHRVPVPARHRGGRRGYGDRLSPREREVAALAATGRSNREIGQTLFLSPETVKKHLHSAMRKLEVRTRSALAFRFARDRSGLPG